MPELRITPGGARLSHAERAASEQSQEDSMTTRAELGQVVAREIAERGADRQWICSLLDRAVEVGQEEIKGRVAHVWGPMAADIATRANGWAELLDMECHVPISGRTK
jgi:hypothetical protein